MDPCSPGSILLSPKVTSMPHREPRLACFSGLSAFCVALLFWGARCTELAPPCFPRTGNQLCKHNWRSVSLPLSLAHTHSSHTQVSFEWPDFFLNRTFLSHCHQAFYNILWDCSGRRPPLDLLQNILSVHTHLFLQMSCCSDSLLCTYHIHQTIVLTLWGHNSAA